MRIPLAVIMAVALAACGDDDPDVPGVPDAPATLDPCPMAKPDEATSCTTPTPSAEGCTYLIEACACGPSDIEWSCRCVGGAWECSRGYDCYPCPDAAM